MALAAHTAFIEIDGAKAKILSFDYSLGRAVDMKGQPTTTVSNLQINVTLRSDSAQMQGKIATWMANQDLSKTGTITIYQDAEASKVLKTITFENAYVVHYAENFSDGGGNTTEGFSITAEKLEIDDAKFNMKWANSES